MTGMYAKNIYSQLGHLRNEGHPSKQAGTYIKQQQYKKMQEADDHLSDNGKACIYSVQEKAMV